MCVCVCVFSSGNEASKSCFFWLIYLFKYNFNVLFQTLKIIEMQKQKKKEKKKTMVEI